ncbi:MAG: reactive intermediate/imine deaminase [Tenericutes bacterium HGW-Tenericutes-3]|nr:MAG: reactive intermediate/imine deaminase [Tenericutes bacterium HGW-Tenericutes-3]
MKNIHTNQAPQAVGPYSQGVLVNGTLYVSGQIPFVPETMKLVSDDIADQTRQSLENILAIVKAAGLKKEDIVRCGVFMTDLGDFSKMNAVYAEFFEDHKPARAAVEVRRLPRDVLVEIDAIAVKSI